LEQVTVFELYQAIICALCQAMISELYQAMISELCQATIGKLCHATVFELVAELVLLKGLAIRSSSDIKSPLNCSTGLEVSI